MSAIKKKTKKQNKSKKQKAPYLQNRAIKYRLEPTKEQKEFFEKNFGCCRFVFNLLLCDKISYYQENGKMLHNTPAKYKDKYPFLREVDSLALTNSQINLETAFTNFFNNPSSGFPKFKSKKHTKKSYTTNLVNGNIELYDDGIKLPKIGKVRGKIHRQPEQDWQLKSVTISFETDCNYYASVLFEYIKKVDDIILTEEATEENTIGFDYKSSGLYMDSNGKCCEMPKYYKRSEKHLGELQSKLKNKKLDSKNYIKQQNKIRKLHKHISNQRKDFLHKESFEIANRWNNVCIESLHIRSMSNKGFGNGKSTLDNGFGMFVNFLEYKLFIRGKELVKVDKYYASSQLCNHCGYKNPLLKDLRIRSWACPVCGVHHDRDINAAINILQEGLHILSKRREEKLKEREEAKQLNKK